MTYIPRKKTKKPTPIKNPQIVRPSHYQASKAVKVSDTDHYFLQVFEVIESFELGFNLGNVTKYNLRAGKKFSPGVDPLFAKFIDLKKSRECLDREIYLIEQELLGQGKAAS